MNYILLLVLDRGGGLFLIVALALLAASLISLPLMPLFHYTQSESLKHIGGRVYGFLGVATITAGLILIPAVIFVIVAGLVVRHRGTGMPQSLAEFALGAAVWLATPVVFILLGKFQVWFSKRLAPAIWDKKMRTAERRRKAKLRQSQANP